MRGQPLPDWLFPGQITETIRRKSAELLDEGCGTAQLIITSPPDLSETRLRRWDALFALYESVFSRCVSSLRDSGVLAVVISDRKLEGTIIWKHDRVRSILERLDMRIFAYKIVVRTAKIDLFRVGFSHLMCFRKKSAKQIVIASPVPREFRPDIWGPYASIVGMRKDRNSFAPQLVRILVEVFSHHGDLVLDPFCGTGTTQRVAIGLGRTAAGYEVNAALHSHWRKLSSPG